MTATMILKAIHALPARENDKLFKHLERETATQTPEPVSEIKLFHRIENIGRQQRTKLSAGDMNAARLEGRK